MSYLYITEFSRMGVDHGGLQSGAPVMPGLAEHRLEIGAISAASPRFREHTRIVMLHATHSCCIAFGDDPKADEKLHRLSPNETRFYGVSPNDKVAVIMAEE